MQVQSIQSNREKMNNSVIIQWNNIYLEAVRKLGGAPGPISRMGAMMHIAMFEVINLLSGSPYESYLPSAKLPQKVEGVDPARSAAYAARKVLIVTIKKTINQAANSPGGVPSRSGVYQVNTGFAPEPFLQERTQSFRMEERDRNPSRTFGEAIADAILQERENDGSQQANTPPVVKFGFAPGDWRETGDGSAVTPQWGKVKPFGGWQSNQIGDFLPEALNVNQLSNYFKLLKSREYAEQVNEVQRLGKADSSERTQEQTEIAFFWANDLDGTYKPPGQLYNITQIVARQEGVEQNLLDTARLFALVGIGMADAGIISWYVKYLFPDQNNPNNLIRLWRPESAIREADTDNNQDTVPEPSWQPLSARRDGTRFSPPFPAYISGHATFGAAHAAMMRQFFGRDAIAFSATTEDPNATRDQNGNKQPRAFPSFTEAARENGRSRIYLGVHYQWDADGGFESGTKVAEFAFNSILRKKGPVVAKGDDMQPGEVLNPGHSISSTNGKYTFIYQGDGNLVLYRNSDEKPLWASNTWTSNTTGIGPGVFIMQGDGNLVIYDSNTNPIWASDTWQHPGSRLVVQDDGNVVMYSPDGTPVWSTNTWQGDA